MNCNIDTVRRPQTISTNRRNTTMNRNLSAISILVAVAAFFTLATQPAYTAAVSWDDGAGDDAWGTAQNAANTNWSDDDVPQTGDDVTIGPGAYTVNYDTALYADGTELSSLTLPGGTTTNDPTLNISASMAIDTGTSAAPFSASGGTVINHNAGTLDLNTTGAGSLSLNANASGDTNAGTTYNLSGTGAIVMPSGISLAGVNNGTVTFNMAGESLTSTGGATGISFNSLTTGNKLFNFTDGTIDLGGSVTVAGATSEFRFDGGGNPLSMTFGTTFNKVFSVDGTLAAVGSPADITVTSTVNGTLRLTANSTYRVELNSTNDLFITLASLDSNAGEDIVLQGGTLEVLDGSNAPVGSTWDILQVTGTDALIDGDFATFNLPEKFVVLDNGQLDGTYTIGVVPEPASLSLLVLGGLALCRRRR